MSQGVTNTQKYYKIVPDDSRMDPGSTQQVSNKCSKIIRNPFKHDPWLPSELLQVTPNTPDDNQKTRTNVERMSTNAQHMAQ